MNLFLPITIAFCLIAISGYAQQNDSTDKYEYKPNEMITISNEWYSQFNTDTFRTTNSSYRSSLLMPDPVLRHCLVTAKLFEYKKGNKIREKTLLAKDKVYKNPGFASFEDSSFVFSLYRAASTENKNRLKWLFRTPSRSNVEEITLTNAEDYITVFIEDIIQTKIPIGKPFVFLVITAPDKTRNFPFYLKENKGKYSPYDWSKKYKLDHTFLIELTVEKSTEPEKKKENSTVL
jgi:hypothetical protein